ncbi:MAG: penicillin-binding transpeptidase domain-containing protein, partial [Planctomycetota bacterium]|nr:penicillin-binding transpeptidase domain-containing protein [Planctomycetota bacterium]
MLLVLVGTALLLVRLYQVQITEASVWTSQAATLVRSGAVRPYQRGAIRDARGRELAHDERIYRVMFSYRDFRREHPLGRIAHARTALLGQPEPLDRTFANLAQWTRDLCRLSPAQLDQFAEGEPLVLPDATVPAGDPDSEARRMRRSDARFYIVQFLGVERRKLKEFATACKEHPDTPLIELAASARGTLTAAKLAERIDAQLAAACGDLRQLAQQLDLDDVARGAQPANDPLAHLLTRLEQWRGSVEDDTASDLFEEVYGFAPGRVEPALVHGTLDLRWIEALLGWDAARSLAWLERARAAWRASLFERVPERLVAELQVSTPERDGPELVLERWVAAFAADPELALLEGWREAKKLAVLDELDELLEGESSGPRPLLFAWQDARALEAEDEGSASWATLARAELGLDAIPDDVAALAADWSEALSDRVDAKFVREHTLALLARCDHDLQVALEPALAARLATAREDGRTRLTAAEGRLDRAAERARYVLKDRGSREKVVMREPSYATVLLLSRHADSFAGLRVEESSERVVQRDERGIPIARGLVGSVGQLDLREQLVEGELRREFIELRSRSQRSEAEESELRYLARRIVRDDELRGRSGLEGYFQNELAGRNGYREVRGLQNQLEGVYLVDVAPVDGLDLVLTLDLDLQQAATACLAQPEGPPNALARDTAWLERPTGAIVLAQVDGDVLAAASFPDFLRDEGDSPQIRDLPLERTLRKGAFEPPGSSFKPFVASYALSQLSLDPSQTTLCAALPSGRGAGYVDVRCAQTQGHGAVGLRYAIQHSCNSYFARLGERYSSEDWRAMAAEFGFGQPTGVRALGTRSGLSEHATPELFRRDLTQRESRLAGNGLSVVEATPMQLARATAGLATGALPQMRLVRSIGGVEQPQGARPLSLAPSALAFVREAMEAVANESGGSGQPALNAGELGFRMAAKTGSGDIDTTVVITPDGK